MRAKRKTVNAMDGVYALKRKTRITTVWKPNKIEPATRREQNPYDLTRLLCFCTSLCVVIVVVQFSVS